MKPLFLILIVILSGFNFSCSSDKKKDEEQTTSLKVTEAFFSKEKWGKAVEKDEFKKGELVYYHVVTIGLKKKEDGKSSFAADLKVLNPKGEVYLAKPQIVQGEDVLDKDELAIFFAITMGADALSGEYQAEVIIYDLQAGSQVTSQGKFKYIP